MNTTLLLLKITILLAITLVLVLALAKANPRWRLLLCEWAALGLLVLPLLSLLPRLWPLPMADPVVAVAPVDAPPVISELSLSDRPETGGGTVNVTGVAEPTGGDGLRRSFLEAELKERLPGALLAIYLAGLFWFACRHGLGARRLRRVLSSLECAGEGAREILADVASRLKLKRVPRLLVAEESIAPLACGAKGGTVVIPRVLLEAGNEKALRMALCHETHHLANRDLLRAGLLQFVVAVLWFHPLAWVLRRCHLLAMEELGDRVAAEEVGTADYARSLAAFALSLRPERSLRPVTVGWFHRPQILRRLHSLKRKMPHTALTRRSRALAVGAIGGPLLLMISTLGYADPKEGEGERVGLSARLAAGLEEETANRAAEAAARTLHYLRSRQREDGSFSAKLEGEAQHQTGTTSLAGAAFLTAGGSKPGSAWRAPMLRCLDYVLQAQDESGMFKESVDGKRSMLYHHFIATWFLAHAKESVDAEREAAIDKALQASVEVILKAQQIKKNSQSAGGWRYTPVSPDSDISCTAWAMEALLAARSAGVKVPAKAIEDGVSYLLRLQNEKDGGFAYAGSAQSSNLARTGMALTLLERTGKGESPEAARAAAYILANAEKGGEPGGPYQYYGLSWCASAMALRGGEDARKFAEWMYPYCIRKQNPDGSFDSSLGPIIPTISVALAMSPAN